MIELPAAQQINAEIDKRLGPLARRVENLRPALEQMAFYLDTQWIENFEQQGRVTKWKPRSAPNTAGIIADLEAGGTIKEHRFDALPALQDTGKLRESGGTEIRGNTIYWGTNVPYAAEMHFGGEKSIANPIPDMLRGPSRGRIERELRKVERRGYEDEAKGLRVRRSYTLQIPARPLVEFTPDDFDTFEEILIEHIDGA